MDNEYIYCDRAECIRAFNELAAKVGADKRDYMHAQHCEHDDCHEIYIRGKNGADCAICGKRACETCQCTKMTDDADLEGVCDDCGAHARAHTQDDSYPR